MISAGWEVDIEITILDDMLRKTHIKECLSWAGRFNGAGDWRPQKGGVFGIFEVK